MAHLNLHEQDQVTKLKYFWRDWGKYIVSIVIVAFVAYLVSFFWGLHSKNQAVKAAAVYAKFTDSVSNNNSSQAYTLANELENSYPSVEYSAMASIWAAKLSLNDKHPDQAIKYLTWTISHAKDNGLADLARLKLANVYIDQQKFDQALSLLMEKHNAAFDVLYYSTRGDLYVAKGESAKARDAYKEAIQKSGQDSGLAQSIQLKLDVLGG